MSNTRLGKLLDKFEAVGTSTRTEGRYTKFMQALSKKLGLGSQVGKNLLLTKDTYPRVTASIFEKGIFLNYWENKSQGQLAGFLSVKSSSSKRPSLKSFTVSSANVGSIDKFKFNGKNFINMTEFNSTKDLVDALSAADLPATTTPSELAEAVEDANSQLDDGKLIDDSNDDDDRPEVSSLNLPFDESKYKTLRSLDSVSNEYKGLFMFKFIYQGVHFEVNGWRGSQAIVDVKEDGEITVNNKTYEVVKGGQIIIIGGMIYKNLTTKKALRDYSNDFY